MLDAVDKYGILGRSIGYGVRGGLYSGMRRGQFQVRWWNNRLLRRGWIGRCRLLVLEITANPHGVDGASSLILGTV